ncbi:hypothetical protein [Sphingomonas panacis]|uniref:hypothetical protein n=1 Tax=Sphingomonas panacis TaxID=1560345 RepID=UPI0019D23C51|nr:hypothetical protein [Sphingomonas panacis]
MGTLTFLRLNSDWNADPNDPDPKVVSEGATLRVAFYLNSFAYKAADGEIGILSFPGCSRWRWDSTNDHGWYSGEGRFAKEAPAWGQFYELVGDETALNEIEWQVIAPTTRVRDTSCSTFAMRRSSALRQIGRSSGSQHPRRRQLPVFRLLAPNGNK